MRLNKILLFIAGVVMSLLISEVVIRIYYFGKFSSNNVVVSINPRLSYEHKPSISLTNKYGVKIRYNSLGFIGDEIAPKKNGLYRILAIGDSITEGVYLPEQSRFVDKVGVTLRSRTGKEIECINGGVGGYNTQQETELIKDKGLRVSPDLILVGVCMNDYVNNKPDLKKTSFNRVLENSRDGSKARYFDFLYQRSDLYKFLYDIIAGLRAGKMDAKAYDSYVRGYTVTISEKDWEAWKASFLDMMKVSKENNIKIVFVIFPLESQVLKREQYSYKPLSDFFKENSASSIDLAPFFVAYADKGEELFRDRDIIHPNAKGHDIAAQAIANYIIDNNIIIAESVKNT